MVLSGVGLRGLTWLASDAGFSVSLGLAVSVAGACTRDGTGGWE